MPSPGNGEPGARARLASRDSRSKRLESVATSCRNSKPNCRYIKPHDNAQQTPFRAAPSLARGEA